MSARRVNPPRRSFVARLAEGDTYGTLLVLIVAAYLIMALVEDSKWARTITGAAVRRHAAARARTRRMCAGGSSGSPRCSSVVLVVWSAALAITDHEPFTGSSHLTILLIAAAPAVILYRVFRHPVINVETILGAIDAYLLIGISFAAIYMMQDDIDPHFFAQGAASGVKFLYFSFVVITTLGFGDLTPRTDIGRVLVSLEALLGQIFLVTVVAVLVANIGRATRHASSAAAAVRDPAEDLADELADEITEQRAEEAVDPERD